MIAGSDEGVPYMLERIFGEERSAKLIVALEEKEAMRSKTSCAVM
jgi:hypothetical protein